MLPGQIVLVVICLVAAGGASIAGWGTYREIRVPKNGLMPMVLGIAIMGFAGIAASIAGKLLHI